MKIELHKMMNIVLMTLVIVIVFSMIYMGKGKKTYKYTEYNKKRIVLLTQIYNNPYWKIIKNGAESAASDRNCFIEYRAPQAASIEESTRIFDMAINAKVDGIIAYVQDEKALTPYIDKAVSKGIPVVTVDTDAKYSKRITYIGSDNVNAGKMAAETLCNGFPLNTKVGILIGGRNTNQLERVEGFKNYIENFSNIKVVDTKSSDYYMVEAKLMVTKMINENPDIKCIYCTSALDGMGAAKAIEDLKRNDIKVITFDDLPETMEYMEKGIIYASIVQEPYQMGFKSVTLIMDYINKKDIEKGNNITKIKVIKKENLVNHKIREGKEKNEEQ